MKLAIATAAVCFALAACSSTPMAQVQPIDGVISGQCHSDRVRGAVGHGGRLGRHRGPRTRGQ